MVMSLMGIHMILNEGKALAELGFLYMLCTILHKATRCELLYDSMLLDMTLMTMCHFKSVLEIFQGSNFGPMVRN